jgi:hypothetical protein
MDRNTSERRRFLKLLGYAALSVQILPLTRGALAVEAAPADSLAVTSSRDSKLGSWVAHTHVLYVPLHLFGTPPPGGITLSTTWTFFHAHEVTLTQDELLTVARGGAVRVKDSAGAHSFSIELTQEGKSPA